jgi:hypothetical protein
MEIGKGEVPLTCRGGGAGARSIITLAATPGGALRWLKPSGGGDPGSWRRAATAHGAWGGRACRCRGWAWLRLWWSRSWLRQIK